MGVGLHPTLLATSRTAIGNPSFRKRSSGPSIDPSTSSSTRRARSGIRIEDVLIVGMGGKNAVINSPVLTWETTQTGFSMYVKYMMAGFLAVFAISMMIQFVSYMLDAVADVRDEPGGRDHSSHTNQ